MPSRFFINKLKDASSATVSVPKDLIKSRILKYVEGLFDAQGVSSKDCDGGLYVGVAGVSYMFHYLSCHPELADHKADFARKSQHFLKSALDFAQNPRNKKTETAFLLGGCGTYAIAASIMKHAGKESEADDCLNLYTSLADKMYGIDFLGCGSDELFVGRAGYLCGILYLEKEFGHQILSEEKCFKLLSVMVKSGEEGSKKYYPQCPLVYDYYETTYLGPAHGLSGILLMLLSFPNFLDKHPDVEKKVKGSVDFMLSIQAPNGNFPPSMDEIRTSRSESDELVHWCHGAPGVVYLMAKAYQRWKEDKYLQSCLACGELTWQKGLLKKGPGICHGVAGSGYVFLLLHRLTNDSKHLHRAIQFGDFIFSDEFKSARVPDSPLSLYEGISGTTCFLADLLQPEKAAFPFFDIF